jgi:hypothetical protein
MRERFQAINELREQIAAAETALANAREAGEDTEELSAQVEEMQAKMYEMMQQMRAARPFGFEGDSAAFGGMEMRRRMQARLQELRQAAEAASAEGRQDEAERIRREAEMLAQAVERGGPPPEARAREVDGRLEYLRTAIANLRAGGFNELADRLEGEARQLAARAEREREEAEASANAARREVRRRGQSEESLNEMQAEIESLRREMEQLRELLRTLTNEERDSETREGDAPQGEDGGAAR